MSSSAPSAPPAPPAPTSSSGQPAGRRPEIRGVTWTTGQALRFQRRSMLVVTVVPLLGLVWAVTSLWGSGLSTTDAVIAVSLYVLTALGITVGYHRYFTHRSFRAARGLRIALGVLGSLAIQGALIDWVATHRRHHAFSDGTGDPHSPHAELEGDGWRGALRGLWFAHVGWMFEGDTTIADTWAPDLQRDPALVWISRRFPWFVGASLVLPALLGLAVTGTLRGALSAFVWGGLVRVFLLHHVTWAINSICHYYGSRPFESHDEARNNLPMALLSLGEGWHNGHHAFPASARHGLRWWELDVSYLTIRLLQAVRLVREVKLPTPAQLRRKTAGRPA